ncbi:DUF5710 domain-containing protein [Azospira oryzae]|uniref:DUF5710 domain-containing protein n=1 Tax=Azospira oryzae TaxID=146939 RepID=UPI0019632972|nr:DUF5710 domain-containing protein [Azospira oryzae]
MTDPKKARVLKSVRWEADLFEQLEVKAKSVGGFNALMNAIAAEWLGKRPVGTVETAEIASRLAHEIEAILIGKTVDKQSVAEPEIAVALAEEVPKSPDILDEISTPKKQPKFDDRGNIILNVPFANKEEAKDKGANWEKHGNPGYWFIPKDFIPHADMEYFERWLA